LWFSNTSTASTFTALVPTAQWNSDDAIVNGDHATRRAATALEPAFRQVK
jgi:hypothetical protein